MYEDESGALKHVRVVNCSAHFSPSFGGRHDFTRGSM